MADPVQNVRKQIDARNAAKKKGSNSAPHNSAGNPAVNGSSNYTTTTQPQPNNTQQPQQKPPYQIPNNPKGSGADITDYMKAITDMGYCPRINELGDKLLINDDPFTTGREARIIAYMDKAGYRNAQKVKIAIQALVDNDNKYNPVKEYLEAAGKNYDGGQHIAKLITYLKCTDPLFPVLFRKWLIGAVSKMYDGTQNMVLSLDGAQGKGKSEFAKWLCPKTLSRYFSSKTVTEFNKDDKITVSSVFIWELGEFHIRESKLEEFKNFVTTSTFLERAPYGHYNEEFPARASFIATFNNAGGILTDQTGNRRFWIFTIDDINWNYKTEIDLDQIWGEAFTAWKSGELFTLTADENKQLQESQENFKVADPYETALTKYFNFYPNETDLNNCPLYHIMTAQDITETLQNPNCAGMKSVSTQKMNHALKNLGATRGRETIQLPNQTQRKQQRIYFGIERAI